MISDTENPREQFFSKNENFEKIRIHIRAAQNFWILGLGTQIVLGFLRIWVWVLGFKIWVLGGPCTR